MAGDLEHGRYIVSGGSCWVAPFQLPTGAIVDTWDFAGCDDSAASDITATLVWCVDGSTCPEGFSILTTGTPGCRRFTSAAALGIDNGTFTYYAKVCAPGGSDTTLTSVRLYYKLRVSSPPGIPTFNDVPTDHPFYQFIEALARSEITGGCGGGNFCPESPVTRGQMAVFLAKALGLHWPDTLP